MPTSDLRRKLRWLIAIRAVISTLLLGSATFAQITAPGSFPVDPFFFLIGLTYALTAFYAATLRLAEGRRWLVDVQLAGDALIVSAFIYFTGGVTSYFTSLYVLPIVAASIVQFRRGGLLVATLSAVLYGGVVLAQYLTVAGYMHDPWLVSPVLPPRSVAQYTYLLNAFGFFAVALLSGSLAERVRTTGVQAGTGLEPDRRSPGAQSARHRQPAERAGDHRQHRPDSDVQPRGGEHHGPLVRLGCRDARSRKCSTFPETPSAPRRPNSTTAGRAGWKPNSCEPAATSRSA